MEKFAGLNFYSFNPTKVFVVGASLARSAYYLRIVLIFTEKDLRCS